MVDFKTSFSAVSFSKSTIHMRETPQILPCDGFDPVLVHSLEMGDNVVVVQDLSLFPEDWYTTSQ